MITLRRSSIDPNWVEILSCGEPIQEIEVRFVLRRFPTRFESIEKALQWIGGMERKLAKNKAYRLLAMRPYPSAIIYSKLIEKGYSSTVSHEIVEELKRLGYLPDEEIVKQLIAQEFKKGYGPRYIEMKLKAKGLDPEPVRNEITDSMQKRKIEEVSVKLGSRADRQKLIQKLARRGFDIVNIMKVID